MSKLQRLAVVLGAMAVGVGCAGANDDDPVSKESSEYQAVGEGGGTRCSRTGGWWQDGPRTWLEVTYSVPYRDPDPGRIRYVAWGGCNENETDLATLCLEARDEGSSTWRELACSTAAIPEPAGDTGGWDPKQINWPDMERFFPVTQQGLVYRTKFTLINRAPIYSREVSH